MTTIRFIREGIDIQCNPGENLRELVLKEQLKLYGLKEKQFNYELKRSEKKGIPISDWLKKKYNEN